ncbi:MAG: carbohydrate ABC transporter permease, partial [Clostridia bacterium]|nr:carbohydrate ABC transporter permease [Clostridia bacterium]
MEHSVSLREQILFLKKHYSKKSLQLFLASVSKRIGIALFRLIIIIGLAFVILYPIIIKLSTSLKPMTELYDPTVFVVPKNPTLQHFKDMISFINYPKTLGNSIFLSGLCGILQMASCVFVAYGLARFKFKGRGIVFGAVLATMVIPPQAILLPVFIQFQYFNIFSIFNFFTIPDGINLINTYWPFVLLSITCNGFKNGLYIYLLRQYFTGVPYVLEEAAYIDGCGPYRTFFKI